MILLWWLFSANIDIYRLYINSKYVIVILLENWNYGIGIMFWQTRHLLNCKRHFWNSWMRQNSEREYIWEVFHSDSFAGHSVYCIGLWEQNKMSEWRVTGCYTGCRSWTASFSKRRLRAQRCLVTAQSFLSASGTFLPLGQSCVYFQGAVFFPGPSWPLSEGFWQRSTLHKRPGHSSCLSLIPSVSSC